MATLTDAWEPASQLEHRLLDALRGGDQNAYFAQLNDAELLLPLPPEEAMVIPADPSAFTWPTATREGRTHVLAYTSVEAARACIGPSYHHFFRMTLSDMARKWPDEEWWLALDSGLPIEGYLPAWFIRDLTAGIAPPLGEAPPQDASAPPPSRQTPVGPPPARQTPVGPPDAERAEVTVSASADEHDPEIWAMS